MLFTIVRIVLWGIITLLISSKIRSSKLVRKKFRAGFIFVFFMGGMTLLGMFPTENLFIDFTSPESVSHYISTKEIERIIYGKKSCMILYTEKYNQGGYSIIPKSEKGYKIPGYFVKRKVSHRFDKTGLFDVLNVVGTKDYYILGNTNPPESDFEVFNGRDERVKVDIFKNKNNYFYFYLENFTDECYLMIGKQKILISE